MNGYSDYRQRMIIDMIRLGNANWREKFFLYSYNKVINALKKYPIPSDILPDILQEVAINILETIDAYDFSKVSSVAVTIRQRAFKAVISYLYTIYDFQMTYNGRVYKNVITYWNAKNHYTPLPSEILGELLRHGKRKNEIIDDIITTDDYMEDVVTNKMLTDRYFEILDKKQANYLEIMMGKMPIHESFANSDKDIMAVTGYSKANIYLVLKKLREELGLDDELSDLLGITHEQKLELRKDKYSRGIK